MEKHTVRIEVADPTPLGLFGLAVVTLVASSQKLGITDGYAMVLPWAIFLGGLAQLIAAMFDFKHNNLFGATAFGAYGLFWLGMGLSWLIRIGSLGDALLSQASMQQLGCAFVAYAILSVILTISTLKMSKAMFWLLLLIAVLFVALALWAFDLGHVWSLVAGATELAISLLSFYVLASKYLSSVFGKTILPQGAPYIK